MKERGEMTERGKWPQSLLPLFLQLSALPFCHSPHFSHIQYMALCLWHFNLLH